MSEPIRILQVFAEMNRGGAETMIMNLYRHIDRTRIQFDFVVHTNEKCVFDDEIVQLGGRIYRVPRYTGKNHFAYKKAWEAFFVNHPDYKIIHGHMRSTASIYLYIAKKYNLITIAHSHSTASRGNMFQRIVKWVMQLPIRFIANYMFACSDEAGKWLFGENTIKSDSYRLIKNAIDVEKYIFNETQRSKMRKLLNIENKFVIGNIGSFTPPKNHEFLVEIFEEVQRIKEDSVLLLIGDGLLRKNIESQIDKLNIKNKVILTGIVPNVNDYLQAIDVFVFPSKFEGLGIVTIEAQAAGLQCIVSDSIPKEAFVTDLIESIPLELSVDAWSTTILQYANGYSRRNTYKEVKSKDYDIIDAANWLGKFYLFKMKGK